MRPILIVVFSLSLLAQGQPNCTGINLDFDSRCACVKDPNSQLCSMVKAGFYDGKMKIQPLSKDWNTVGVQPATLTTTGTTRTTAPQARPQAKTQTAKTQTAQPQQARLVPLTHKDYLRFLQPNARLIAGFDFEKAFQSPELMEAILGQGEGDNSRNQVAGMLKETDHLWMSFVSSTDVLILMTGKFEQGVTAGIFYSQGIRPVFLGGARVMMVGPEPSIQAALARLAKPASPVASAGPASSASPASNDGWVTRRARELSRDHETFFVNEVPPPATQSNVANQGNGAFSGIRRFSLGFRLTGEGSVDGEAVADSEANAGKITAWVDQAKTGGVLDALNITHEGATLRFDLKGDTLMNSDKGKSAMNSDLGAELYGLLMSGFPGVPQRAVAEDKLLAVKTGMKREDVLSLLGPPLTVSAIYGLDTPRETWTYQIPFGKQLSFKLDGGVVASVPH